MIPPFPGFLSTGYELQAAIYWLRLSQIISNAVSALSC
jgi:hypothetical protein